jgi:hypothetical protein
VQVTHQLDMIDSLIIFGVVFPCTYIYILTLLNIIVKYNFDLLYTAIDKWIAIGQMHGPHNSNLSMVEYL